MVRVFGRKQRQPLAVHANPVEVDEIRIASLLAAHAEKIELPLLLVDAQQLRDVPLAGRDLMFQGTGLQVVQVQLSPVVALREPDHFVRCRQIAPVHASVSRLVERVDLLRQHGPHVTGCGVGDAQGRLLVIARGRDERQLRPVRMPLHVAPVAAGRRRDRRASIDADPDRHLETDDLRCRHIDDHALDHEDRARRRAADTSRPGAADGRRGCRRDTSRRRLRPSCWNVAIFFESGDQSTIGRSLFDQPALSVA